MNHPNLRREHFFSPYNDPVTEFDILHLYCMEPQSMKDAELNLRKEGNYGIEVRVFTLQFVKQGHLIEVECGDDTKYILTAQGEKHLNALFQNQSEVQHEKRPAAQFGFVPASR